MKDHTTPQWKELVAVGNESISLTPSTARQMATFNISGVPTRNAANGDRNYCRGFWVHAQTTVDPDAAGNAVSWDKLAKLLASVRLASNAMGEVFAHQHVRGAPLFHIIDVIARGYRYTQRARAQIPANTDSDVTVDLFYFLPLSYHVLAKPHETSQWVGFFDGGVVEAQLDTTTVFDGDYAGAVIKAPTTIRAYEEYFPSPDAFVGAFCEWREREIAGGGTTPVLKAVGIESNLADVLPGAGLGALMWLTDATGIGMNGPDGVDNISAIEIPWRGQPLLRNIDPFFLALDEQTEGRVGPIAGLGTTIMPDSAAWPFTMDTTVNNRPGANSQALFLPLVMPSKDQETSKLQRVASDLQINFTFTATVSSSHRFLSWEFREVSQDKLNAMAIAMHANPAVQGKKSLADNTSVEGKKLRYVRTIFAEAA